MHTEVKTDHAEVSVESPWKGRYADNKTQVVVSAPKLRIRITTTQAGRHWVELLQSSGGTTLMAGEHEEVLIKTPFTGGVAHNYEPKRTLVAVEENTE